MRNLVAAIGLSGAGFAVSPAAHACFVPPQHVYVSHEEAIADATWIAHVRAMRSGDEAGVRLEIVEHLKGEGPDLIEFPPRPEAPFPPFWPSGEWIKDGNVLGASNRMNSQAERTAENFYDHRASHFWAEGSYNFNTSDCTIWPRFSPDGSEYLVFGPLDYNVGFEKIDTPDDAWISFVREELASGEAEAPFPIPIVDYLQSLEAVVRIEFSLDGDAFSFSETVLIGDQPSYLETLFALPEAQLRDIAQCVARQGNRDSAQIDRVYFLEVPEARASLQRDYIACSRFELDDFGGRARAVELRTFGRLAQNRLQVLDVRDGTVDLGELSGRHRDVVDADDHGPVRVEELRALAGLEN